MPAHIDILDGRQQINPAATTANQYFYILGGPQPAHGQAEPGELQGEYRLYVHHDRVNVPELIREAKQHIVLHAAYYPKYGFDDQGLILMEALAANPHLRLHAIFTKVDGNPWIEEFAEVLRPTTQSGRQKRAMTLSKEHFTDMQENLKERNQIRISTTDRLPLFPVLLIDDTVIVGHYAHSRTVAPHGFWMTIKHRCIPDMYHKLLCDAIDYSAYTDEERAILRYLEELKIPDRNASLPWLLRVFRGFFVNVKNKCGV